jgi:hypothetical protein
MTQHTPPEMTDGVQLAQAAEDLLAEVRRRFHPHDQITVLAGVIAAILISQATNAAHATRGVAMVARQMQGFVGARDVLGWSFGTARPLKNTAGHA